MSALRGERYRGWRLLRVVHSHGSCSLVPPTLCLSRCSYSSLIDGKPDEQIKEGTSDTADEQKETPFNSWEASDAVHPLTYRTYPGNVVTPLYVCHGNECIDIYPVCVTYPCIFWRHFHRCGVVWCGAGLPSTKASFEKSFPRAVTLQDIKESIPGFAPRPGSKAAELSKKEKELAKFQRSAAESVSAMMFPWERAQLNDNAGKPLRWWEKLYWGLFVMSIVYLLVTRLGPSEEEVAASKSSAVTDGSAGNMTQKQLDTLQMRRKAARSILAGQWPVGLRVNNGEEDPFHDMTPDEIQSLIDRQRELIAHGGKTDDPFEGYSPDEIEEILAGGDPVSLRMSKQATRDMMHVQYAMLAPDVPAKPPLGFWGTIKSWFSSAEPVRSEDVK